MSLACFSFETGVTQNGLLNGVCFVAFCWQVSDFYFFFSELMGLGGLVWKGGCFQA